MLRQNLMTALERFLATSQRYLFANPVSTAIGPARAGHALPHRAPSAPLAQGGFRWVDHDLSQRKRLGH
jgi:hypothetical protein